MRTRFGEMAASAVGEEWAWFRNNSYDPPFLRMMSDDDHQTLLDWHAETTRDWPNAGASGIEMMTMLTSVIASSGLGRIVQCGHYVGFSTLVIGFICKHMNKERFLFSVDLDPVPSSYTQKWLNRSGLTDDIKIAIRDSSDPVNVEEARAFLGGAPQLVYIDSSHQYEHTARELDLWWGALEPGGLLIMDDVSLLAADFDRTNLGGSHRAALEFCQTKGANSILVNAQLGGNTSTPLVYTDVCGFGLLQKPF